MPCGAAAAAKHARVDPQMPDGNDGNDGNLLNRCFACGLILSNKHRFRKKK
jgi:hypothetical protein